VRRTIKIVSATAPALALAGWIVIAQAQPDPVNPVARGAASVHLDQNLSGDVVADAAGATRLKPATSGKNAAAASAGKQKPAHASPAASAKTTAKAPSPASSATSARTSGATLTCTGTGGTGMLPLNYATIVSFLVRHGYTDLAAAGIAGNIWQESHGNPESVGTGGGGLIGWTPLPAGFVTGNAAADLQTQLGALLTYNQGWAQYIPMLNAATTATAAADVYMNYFERPGLPAAANREGAAVAVAQACGIS
jgi:Phage tail lysozyme